MTFVKLLISQFYGEDMVAHRVLLEHRFKQDFYLAQLHSVLTNLILQANSPLVHVPQHWLLRGEVEQLCKRCCLLKWKVQHLGIYLQLQQRKKSSEYIHSLHHDITAIENTMATALARVRMALKCTPPRVNLLLDYAIKLGPWVILLLLFVALWVLSRSFKVVT